MIFYFIEKQKKKILYKYLWLLDNLIQQQIKKVYTNLILTTNPTVTLYVIKFKRHNQNTLYIPTRPTIASLQS